MNAIKPVTPMSHSIVQLLGKKLLKVEATKAGNELLFTVADGTQYRMSHWQCCCERVFIADICGNLNDLENSWILMAEERTNEAKRIDPDDFYADTWTFYKLATLKGYVTISWFGTSFNHLYRVDVGFVEVGSEYDWGPNETSHPERGLF